MPVPYPLGSATEEEEGEGRGGTERGSCHQWTWRSDHVVTENVTHTNELQTRTGGQGKGTEG
eukprot:9248814-Alexandrium_andersonii.AAC.1